MIASLELPEPLAEVVTTFTSVDRTTRLELLLEYAERFVEVPPTVATRPFPALQRVPGCATDTFVFAASNGRGTLDYHFAIEGTDRLSARAWAFMLGHGCSGQPLATVARVPDELVLDVFGRALSMGKGLGLVGMLELVRRAARRRLADPPLVR